MIPESLIFVSINKLDSWKKCQSNEFNNFFTVFFREERKERDKRARANLPEFRGMVLEVFFLLAISYFLIIDHFFLILFRARSDL